MLPQKIPRSPTIFMLCTSLLLVLVGHGGASLFGDFNHCRSKLTSAGISPDSFCFHIAHGLHSLKIEYVKHYVGVDLPDKNFIPNVQVPNNTLQWHLPRMNRNPDGISFVMKILDYYLGKRVFWKPKLGIGMLENLAHDAHMHDLWTQMKPLYKKIEINPPDEATCGCLLNEQNNGIIGALRIYRDWLQRFDLCRDGDYYAFGNGRNLCNGRSWWSSYTCDSVNNEYPKNENNPLSLPRIKNPWTWFVWKGVLNSILPDNDEINQFALYLYCKLKPYAN